MTPVVFDRLIYRRWAEVADVLGFHPDTVDLTWIFEPRPHFKAKRGYAMCEHISALSCRLVFAEKILKAPIHRTDGVVRHELAHAVDFVFNRMDLDRVGLAFGVALPKTAERRADAIAYMVWNTPIYYDVADLVQTTSAYKSLPVRPVELGL